MRGKYHHLRTTAASGAGVTGAGKEHTGRGDASNDVLIPVWVVSSWRSYCLYALVLKYYVTYIRLYQTQYNKKILKDDAKILSPGGRRMLLKRKTFLNFNTIIIFNIVYLLWKCKHPVNKFSCCCGYFIGHLQFQLCLWIPQ